MNGLEIQRLLVELSAPTDGGEWELIAGLYGQAVQPTYDFIRSFSRPRDANARQLVAVLHLINRSVSDLLVAGHLVTHRYVPQAYSVLRPVVDASDLIRLFVQEPEAAETWTSTADARREFAPGNVRKRLRRPKYDRMHGLLSELGSHPRFSGARMNRALAERGDPEWISTDFSVGPAPMWHPTSLWAWRFAFETIWRLTEATLDVTTLAGDVDKAFDDWIRGQLRCVDALQGGTLLVRRKLGEDASDDEATYEAVANRLRAMVDSEQD